VDRLIIVILLSFITLTGCSSPEPELAYDPVELIEYERCLNNPGLGYTEEVWNIIAELQCEGKKPVLK
jgi:hypothetical protein